LVGGNQDSSRLRPSKPKAGFHPNEAKPAGRDRIPDVHARLGHPATARRAAFVLARRVSAGNHCPRNLSPFRGDTLADVPPLMGLLYLYGTLTPGLRPGLTQMSPLRGLPCRQIHQRDKKSDDYRLEVAPPQAGFARVGFLSTARPWQKRLGRGALRRVAESGLLGGPPARLPANPTR